MVPDGLCLGQGVVVHSDVDPALEAEFILFNFVSFYSIYLNICVVPDGVCLGRGVVVHSDIGPALCVVAA